MQYKIGIKKGNKIPADTECILKDGTWVNYYIHVRCEPSPLHINYTVPYRNFRRPLKSAESRKPIANKRYVARKARPKSPKAT